MPQPKLSESDYVGLLNLVDSEIDNAFIIFHTYEALNQFALRDEALFAVLNEDALFWKTYRSTLLTSLFMTLSRIFDSVAGAITVQKLVTATLGNLHLFSKDALRARKKGHGPEPWWLADFMIAVWVPAEPSELRHLQKALNPHITYFTSVYLPIRNHVYAHRLMTDDQAGAELFPKTNREQLKNTLDFLRDLIDAIRMLYNNGVEPKLGRVNSIDEIKVITSGAERVLRKLADRRN